MGALFRFYPMPIGNQLIVINLNEKLAELYSDWQYESSTGQTMNGKLRTSTMLNREVITIIRDRMQGGEELGHKFAALQNHLDRGYSVHFTADNGINEDWVYPVKSPPSAGDTTLEVYGNPFQGMGITNKPGAGVYCVLESAPPGGIYEIVKIASVGSGFSFQNGGTVTLASGVNFTYPGPTYLRWYRTWPILKRLEADRGKSIITNEHGLTWSLEIRLTPDYDLLYGFHPNKEDFEPSTNDNSLTPEGVIIDPSTVFGDGLVNLDNGISSTLEDTFETSSNMPWNNWQNWGM